MSGLFDGALRDFNDGVNQAKEKVLGQVRAALPDAPLVIHCRQYGLESFEEVVLEGTEIPVAKFYYEAGRDLIYGGPASHFIAKVCPLGIMAAARLYGQRLENRYMGYRAIYRQEAEREYGALKYRVWSKYAERCECQREAVKDVLREVWETLERLYKPRAERS